MNKIIQTNTVSNPHFSIWIKKNVIGIKQLSEQQKLPILNLMSKFFDHYLKKIPVNSSSEEFIYERKSFPRLKKSGLLIHLLGNGETIENVEELKELSTKQVDEVFLEYKNKPGGDRHFSTIRGLGLHRILIAAIDEIPESNTGKFNVFFHEFAHFLHMTCLNLEQLQAISSLYQSALTRNKFLDDYCSINEYEYFAQGFEAFFNDKKSVTQKSKYHVHQKKDLIELDKPLYNFLSTL